MSPRLLFVHDEPDFAGTIVAALQRAPKGYEVASFTSSMSALDDLEHSKRVDVIITRTQFPSGQPNGVSLALMARTKCPGVKVLFLAKSDVEEFTKDIGEMMHAPFAADDVVDKVSEMLRDPKTGPG